MSIDFAAIEARLGRSTVARLGNRTLNVAGSDVDGVFNDRPTIAALGGAGMQSDDITFTVLAADLDGLTVEEGAAVLDGAVAYTVAERTDLLATQQTVLTLKRA